MARAGSEYRHWSVGAHQLLNGMRDAGRVFAQKTLILRMLGEMKHLQAHVRRNSIEPANEQVEGEADQFVIRKRAPFDLCTKRKAESVIGRIVPPDRKSTRLNSSH